MSVAIIPDFVKYQIEWLTSHKDLEFEPVIEDAIVKMLQDTGKSFIDEQAVETSQFDHIADSGRKASISHSHENDLIFRKAAIDAVEKKQRRGHWIVWGGMDIPENHGKHKCSVCGEFAPVRYEKPLIKEYLSDFCPNCGADMRGGERRMIEQETVDIMRRIEALKRSEPPKSSERAAETAQAMSRIDDTIADVAYILDMLMAYRNIIQTGNCNSCRMARPASCPYVPKPGQLVRYNCPFYKGLGQEVEGNK